MALVYQTDELRVLLTMTLGVEHSLIFQSSRAFFQWIRNLLPTMSCASICFTSTWPGRRVVSCIAQVQENFQKILDDEPDYVSRIMDFLISRKGIPRL